MSDDDDIRSIPAEEYRHPVGGETVETPDGRGVVDSVETWEDVRWGSDLEDIKRLRARLGGNFTAKYARVTVSLEDTDDTRTYDVWELKYDHERDPVDDPPWRG